MKKFLGSLLILFSIASSLTARNANAGINAEENTFLHSRLSMVSSYSNVDEETRETLYRGYYGFYSVEGTAGFREFIRDLDVYFAAQAAVVYGTVAAGAVGITEIPAVDRIVSEFPRATRVVEGIVSGSVGALIEKFAKQTNGEKSEVLTQVNETLFHFHAQLGVYAIFYPSSEKRLSLYQRSFGEFLEARETVDKLFETAIDKICERPLNFPGVWHYGQDQKEVTELRLMQNKAQSTLDGYETNYIEEAVLKISQE